MEIDSVPVCPITLVPFREPVLLLDGHTYERKVVKRLAKKSQDGRLVRSPLHNGPLPYGHGGFWYTRQMTSLGNEWVGKCSISREPLRVPMFYTANGAVYEYDEFMRMIECEQRTAAEKWWRQTTFARRIARSDDKRAFLIPHYALAKALGLDIPSSVQTIEVIVASPQPPPAAFAEAFARPHLDTLSAIDFMRRPLYYDTDDEAKQKEALLADMRAAGLPIVEDGYAPDQTVFFHLNLSDLVIKRGFKGAVFYDCNLNGAVFRDGTPRCQFNRCDMRGCVFLGEINAQGKNTLNMDGEEVAFSDSTMDGALFTTALSIEVGETWRKVRTPSALAAEIKARGGRWTHPPHMLDVDPIRPAP